MKKRRTRPAVLAMRIRDGAMFEIDLQWYQGTTSLLRDALQGGCGWRFSSVEGVLARFLSRERVKWFKSGEKWVPDHSGEFCVLTPEEALDEVRHRGRCHGF